MRVPALAVFVWLAALLVASAQTPPATTSPLPDALAQRVNAFWTTWQARDLAGMYPFYCAPYREKVPRTEYLKLTRLLHFPILEFRVMGADVQDARADVKIWLKSDSLGPIGQFESETHQIWLRGDDGVWCREDEPLILPFTGAP